jgi:hypothetical protein
LPVTVRFGGVRNFDEVSRFFAVERRDGLHYLRFVPRHRQKPGDLAIEVEFDRFGDRVAVLCRNVTVKP